MTVTPRRKRGASAALVCTILLGIIGAAYSAPLAAAAGSPNAGFVTAGYKVLLGRAPDSLGFSYWTGAVDTGTAPPSFTNGLAYSTEGRQVMVNDAYRSFLGRAADSGGLSSWVAAFRDGHLHVEL